MKWFANIEGKRVGPVSCDVLKQLAAAGAISPSTTLENEEGETREAGSVEGLFETSAGAADSTLERLVDALTKIDASLNRLNDRLEALEKRLEEKTAVAAPRGFKRRTLAGLDEDAFDAPGALGGLGGGLKVGERDDEWVSPNELKAAETAEKIVLEPGTYRAGIDLKPGRYYPTCRNETAVLRVQCSQWRSVTTLSRDKEKQNGAFCAVALKLIDGATLRTDDPINLVYLGPIDAADGE